MTKKGYITDPSIRWPKDENSDDFINYLIREFAIVHFIAYKDTPYYINRIKNDVPYIFHRIIISKFNKILKKYGLTAQRKK